MIHTHFNIRHRILPNTCIYCVYTPSMTDCFSLLFFLFLFVHTFIGWKIPLLGLPIMRRCLVDGVVVFLFVGVAAVVVHSDCLASRLLVVHLARHVWEIPGLAIHYQKRKQKKEPRQKKKS